MECWVEIPQLPRPGSTEDGLGFVRPRDKTILREKGKQKENTDSLVWLVDQQPAGADPFYFAEQDLREDGQASHLVAVRPRAGNAKASSAQPAKSKKRKSRTGSSVSVAQPAEASSSSSKKNSENNSIAPSATRAASLLEASPHTNLLSSHEDGLDDMFLGSSDVALRNAVEREDAAPLFFEVVSDQEDMLRNEAPARSQPSQQPRIKTSPIYGNRIAQGSSSHRSRSSSPLPAMTVPSSRNDKPNSTKEQPRKDKDRDEDNRKEKVRAKENERESAAQGQSKSKKHARSADSDTDPKSKPKSDDVNNLRSELNENAFTRSTGARHKEEYRNKLAAFAQARKKARQERGESVNSGSDDEEVSMQRRRLGNGRRATTVSSDSGTSSSDSSDDSSSTDESEDFIVADDQVEYDEGFQPEEDELPAFPTKKKPSQPQRYNFISVFRAYITAT